MWNMSYVNDVASTWEIFDLHIFTSLCCGFCCITACHALTWFYTLVPFVRCKVENIIDTDWQKRNVDSCCATPAQATLVLKNVQKSLTWVPAHAEANVLLQKWEKGDPQIQSQPFVTSEGVSNCSLSCSIEHNHHHYCQFHRSVNTASRLCPLAACGWCIVLLLVPKAPNWLILSNMC